VNKPVRVEKSTAGYETQGPAFLADMPPIASREPPVDEDWPEVWGYFEQRLGSLKNWRLSWWAHWAELAETLLPRRYKWLITPNTMTRGMPINQNILDGSGTQAMRVCVAGIHTGVVSQSRPWYAITARLPEGVELPADGQAWFDHLKDTLDMVLTKGNFYEAEYQVIEDAVVFGNGPILIYEDEKDIVRFYTPAAGEYYLGTGSTLRIDTFYRTFTWTVAQIVEMFGLDNVGSEVQTLWRNKGASLDVEYVVAHAIEPNFPISRTAKGTAGVVCGGFTWREYYWLYGIKTQAPLSKRGFHSKPFSILQWARASNDAYARSASMDALPDLKQLNLMVALLAEAIEKMVKPPMMADVSMKNLPSSVIPGELTYVQDLARGGIKPIYQVDPKVADLERLIAVIQERIKRWFFNDVFMMISSMPGVQPRNELEIAQRREEGLQQLAPIIDKFSYEHAPQIFERLIDIIARRRNKDGTPLLRPRPASLANIPISIEFISSLTIAQRGAATASIEGGLKLAGAMEEVWPGVKNNIDENATIRNFLDDINFPKKNLRAPEQVAAMAKAMAQAQAQALKNQQAAQLAGTAVQGAKALSETDVGGGQNALAALLGTQGGAGGGAAPPAAAAPP